MGMRSSGPYVPYSNKNVFIVYPFPQKKNVAPKNIIMGWLKSQNSFLFIMEFSYHTNQHFEVNLSRQMSSYFEKQRESFSNFKSTAEVQLKFGFYQKKKR